MTEYIEVTQLLVPDYGSGQYEVIDLTDILVAESSLGAAPRHFLTQRGVYQHGSTPIGMRYDERVIRLVIQHELPSRLKLWLDHFKLNKSFSVSRNVDVLGNITPCIYRKVLMRDDVKWRSDLVTTAASTAASSISAEFANWGCAPGSVLHILSGVDAGYYIVAECLNENSLTLETALTATATGVEYNLYPGPIIRELEVLMERGPQFPDDKRRWSRSYNETLRLVANYPMWRNPLQQRVSAAIDLGDNLIFYGDPGSLDRAEFPIWFGTDELTYSTSVIYVGDVPTRPTIVATGPFTYIEVENNVTGDTVGMRYPAANGEVVTINLQALTATNVDGTVLTQYLIGDQVSFYLYPHPNVEDGINYLNFYMVDGLPDVSLLEMYWQAQYEGT